MSGPVDYSVALAAFLALWLVELPFPLVIAVAGLAGVFLSRAEADTGPAISATGKAHGWTVLATGATLLLVIYVAVRLSLGRDPFDGVATLFTSAAFVSFGGAYALLPYVADRAVETYGWLSAAQMLNGLALAEATPGPLILVNLYAGFFAGWPSGAGGGVLAAILTCIYTFVPSFTLILAAAPYIESVQRIRWIRRALAGVAAAVVGVVLNLTIYLGEAALFPHGLSAPEWPKIVLLLAFGTLALWRSVPITQLVGLGAAAGLSLWAVGVI